MTDLPYASSTRGQAREAEIRNLLRGAGATAIGFMVDDDADLVICQFRIVGQQVTVPISVAAYETAWLRSYKAGPRTDAKTHKARARKQAEIAVWAVMADWVKAQTAMIQCGFTDPVTAFLPHMHTQNGQRMIEVIKERGTNLLPPPVVS